MWKSCDFVASNPVAVQVVPPSKCLPGHSALVQDVPPTVLVQNVPPSISRRHVTHAQPMQNPCRAHVFSVNNQQCIIRCKGITYLISSIYVALFKLFSTIIIVCYRIAYTYNACLPPHWVYSAIQRRLEPAGSIRNSEK